MKDRPKFAAILQTSLTWERGRDEFNERTTYAYVLFAVWILCPSVCLVNERMTGGYSSKCVEMKVRRRRLKGFLKVVLWTSKEQTNYVCSSSIFSEWRSEFKIRWFVDSPVAVSGLVLGELLVFLFCRHDLLSAHSSSSARQPAAEVFQLLARLRGSVNLGGSE